MNYILEGKIPKTCNDLIKWAQWFEKADRFVNKTDLPNNIQVSTVFLGLDHGGNTPLLFETMIFGGKHDQYQERYATWDEAEKGHKEAVKLAKKEIELKN